MSNEKERGGTLQTKSIFCSAISSRGNNLAQKKENEKSFYSLILLEQRFPLKIFLAKYVRILVKSVQLGYSSGNLSESFRIYQRLGASKRYRELFQSYKEIVADQRPQNTLSHEYFLRTLKR